MEKIKNNKLLFILLTICLIIVIAVICLSIFLIPKSSDGKYGNRLDEIENYSIDESKIEEMKKTLKENEAINDVTYHLSGKLINIIIELEDTLDVNTAKEYANKTLEYFTSEQLSFYDLQVYLNSANEESENYPLIGYKNKNSEQLIWKQ